MLPCELHREYVASCTQLPKLRVTPQVARNARNQTVLARVADNLVKALEFCHGNEQSRHWDALVALHTLSVLIQVLRWKRQQSLGDI